jgi:hypothetical protein
MSVMKSLLKQSLAVGTSISDRDRLLVVVNVQLNNLTVILKKNKLHFCVMSLRKKSMIVRVFDKAALRVLARLSVSLIESIK